MEKKPIDTVSENIAKIENNEVDLDQALSAAGKIRFGWYNIKYCLVLALFLISAIIEPVGYSFVLPAAKCDLQMTDSQRGLIGSVPYIAIVITSFVWGYLADTRGRKGTVMYSSFAAGILAITAAFMPNLTSFAIFKFLSSLCIACPAAVPYTFIGEILPQRYRDITLSLINALQVSGTALVPLMAWIILPLDFRIHFGLYEFRSWRVLAIVNSSLFIISGFLMMFGPESPKYLISQGRHDESLQVLKTMYTANIGKPAEFYPVKRLKMPQQTQKEKSLMLSLQHQTLPLFRAPYLKWMVINGTLFFGLFATANGLYMWLPDVLNRVLTGKRAGLTACEVIAQRLNETIAHKTICDDSIDTVIFMINTIANISCAIIVLGLGSTVKYLGKKTLLIFIYVTLGVFCILINFITQDILFAILLSSLPTSGLAIGPINAFAVEIFPTNLRAMAICLTMMVGRSGSIVGANIVAALISAACEVTFYLFGGLLIFCGALSSLLPTSKSSSQPKADVTHL